MSYDLPIFRSVITVTCLFLLLRCNNSSWKLQYPLGCETSSGYDIKLCIIVLDRGIHVIFLMIIVTVTLKLLDRMVLCLIAKIFSD